jgi:DNA-binding NtrC family response regulator
VPATAGRGEVLLVVGNGHLIVHAIAGDEVVIGRAEDCDLVLRPTPELFTALTEHDWPGNVRELKAVIDRAVLLARVRDRAGGTGPARARAARARRAGERADTETEARGPAAGAARR